MAYTTKRGKFVIYHKKERDKRPHEGDGPWYYEPADYDDKTTQYSPGFPNEDEAKAAAESKEEEETK